MVSPNYGAFMRSLAEYEPFLKVLSASEDQLEKQRHMEYVSRFLVHTYLPYDGKLDVEEFIDEGIVELAQKGETNDAGSTFRKTFELLNGAYGDGALKRIQNGVPHGRVGLAALECIAVGVAKNLTAIEAKQTPLDYVRKRIAEFWQAPQLSFFFSAGLRGTIRLQRTVPFGTEWFST
jgi:hypothetical protein